ncbi:MAG: hypothetical protein JWL59_2947 [Chthoniobacteraceae bacterium]|nr:hypothetical protein [Chthoniobacteraceae bacterium]
MKAPPFLLCLGILLVSLVTASGQSQSEMNLQAQKDFEKADAKLNSVYKKLIAALDAGGQAKLKAAQRAWIAFRDAEAEFQADAEARGGSMAPLIRAATAEELTKKRTEQLSVVIGTFSEKDARIPKK